MKITGHIIILLLILSCTLAFAGDEAILFSTIDTISEGESKEILLNNEVYIVENIIISDSNDVYTKLKINGEVTDNLHDNDVYTLSNGARVKILQLKNNEPGDVSGDLCEFMIYIPMDKETILFSTTASLGEGETKDYILDNKQYEIENIIVTDSNNIYTQLKINGEVTNKLWINDTYTLVDGVKIKILEIINNEAGDVTSDRVHFMLYIPSSGFDFKFLDYTLDLDNNSLSDYLIINMSMNVIKSETYTITAILTDSNDNNYTYKAPYASLGVGRHTIPLKLTTFNINIENSPFRVSKLNIKTNTFDFEYNNIYTTKNYNSNIFEKNKGYILPGFKYENIDIDNDGLIDRIDIEYKINVTESSKFSYANRMSGYKINYNEVYLTKGIHTINTSLSGLEIYHYRINGTYNMSSYLEQSYPRIVPDITVSRSTRDTFVLTSKHFFELGQYNYQDFEPLIISRTNYYDSYVVDIDNNGLYDYIQFETDINVSVAGRYDIEFRNEFDGGHLRSSNDYNLVAGINRIQYNISGQDLYFRKANDTLDLVRLDIEYNDHDYASSPDSLELTNNYNNPYFTLYSTIHYNYNDFERDLIPPNLEIINPLNNSIVTNTLLVLNISTIKDAYCGYNINSCNKSNCDLLENRGLDRSRSDNPYYHSMSFELIDKYEYEITYICTDRYNNKANSTIKLTANTVDDSPIFTGIIQNITLDEDSTKEIDINNYFSDIDSKNLELSYISSNNISISIINKIATITPSTDWYGEEIIYFTASDGNSNVTSNPVKITVNNINDAPIITDYTSNSHILIADNKTKIFNINFTDSDNDNFNVTWYLNNKVVSNENTYTFNSIGTNSYNLTVNVADNELIASKKWSIDSHAYPYSASFDSTTTKFNLMNESELKNANNVIIAKSSKGSISFLNTLDLTEVVDIDGAVNIDTNLVAIDTTKYPQLSKPARIIMTGLSYDKTPIIYYDNGFTTNIDQLSTTCPVTLCSNITYNVDTGILEFNVAHFTTFGIKQNSTPNKIEIERLDVYVDSDKDRINNKETIRDVRPESEVKFKLELKNNHDIDFEEVSIDITIKDIDDGDDFEDDIDNFNIDSGDYETESITFNIPLKVDEGNYDVIIEIKAEDENNNVHILKWQLELEIEKENNELMFENVDISDNKLDCFRNTNLDIKIRNIGSDDEDDIKLSIKNSQLGINIEENFELDSDPFDSDNSKTFTIPLEIANNVMAGKYLLNMNAYYNSDRDSISKEIEINIGECQNNIITTQIVPKSTQQKELIEIKSSNNIQSAPNVVTKFDSKTSNSDSSYITLLICAFIILSGFLIYLCAYMYFKYL